MDKEKIGIFVHELRKEKQMTQNVETFLDVLKERNYEGLTIDYEVIDGFDHNTVFKPSIKNAMLKFYGK